MNMTSREKNIQAIGYSQALGDLQAWILANVTDYDTRTLRALNVEIARLNQAKASDQQEQAA